MVDGIDSYAETFGSILKSHPQIQIPLYQRAFSWKSVNIASLWSDIIQTRRLPKAEQTLFLGPAVFHKDKLVSGETIRYLVDGQQRITTISLFLAHIRNTLKEIDRRGAGAAFPQLNELLFQVDAESQLDEDPDVPLKLELSKKDSEQFMKYVRYDTKEGYRTYLKMAFDTVESLVEETIQEDVEAYLERQGIDAPSDEDREDAREEAYVKLAIELNYLLNNVACFSMVSVEDPFDPLTVFESLNSKGMPLAQSDLVKNLLIQHVPQNQQEGVAREWDSLVDDLEGSLINFLRYWYISQHDFIRKKELYESIKTLISEPRDVHALLDEWQQASEWYLAIQGEKKPPNRDSRLEKSLKRFSVLGFRQANPVLLSFALKGEHKDMAEAVPVVSSTYIRLFVTASVRGSIFEKLLDDICTEIRNTSNGLDKLKMECNKVIRQYCPEMNWKHLRVDDGAIQKYLLIQINRAVLGDPTWDIPSSAEIEVEHVLPQTRKEGTYEELDEVEYDLLINHIGNLTLILDQDNPRCGNEDFSEKIAVYAEYDGEEREYEIDGEQVEMRKDIPITAEIARFDGWGPKSIETRAQNLAGVAEKLWPAEF